MIEGGIVYLYGRGVVIGGGEVWDGGDRVYLYGGGVVIGGVEGLGELYGCGRYKVWGSDRWWGRVGCGRVG